MGRGIITIIALGVPMTQVVLMGVFGYPYARSSPARMNRFHRSGFYWWLAALAVTIALAFVFPPKSIPIGSLAGHDWSATRFVLTVLFGLAGVLAIELGFDRYTRLSSRPWGADARARYDGALPDALRSPRLELGVLVLIAVMEEAVFRGVALAGLLTWAGLSKAAASGITSVAFGIAHWYYGPVQIWLKSLVGAVLCAVALSSGLLAAMTVHVLLNVVLTLMSRRSVH